MGKRRLSKGQWIFWVVALFGWFAPAGVLATSGNLLVNGNFSADEGGWIGANGGASCSGGSPSLGVWGGGPQLTFSYVQNSVTQQVSIASPSALELSFLANGPSGGTYSATISDSDQSVTTGVLTAGENQVSNLGITTTQNDEVVTITFAGKDSLFWAGCYGPVIRNASLTVVAPAAFVPTGYPADQQWEAVTYGDGKFVAVASSGDGNRVMTSTNGNYWTSRTSASNGNWQGITYADNQFVAVGSNAVMTSPDGVTWTSRTAPTGEWQAITNCGGLFVATATWGSNYVMTSTNGSDWTVRTPAHGWSHDAVACSASVPRFVSVSQFGRGWSSADGISGWSIQNPGAIVDIRTVAFGNGRFSWLEYSTNSGNRYGGYSTNGLNWSNTPSAPSNQWKYITYGGDKFIAVAEGGLNSRSAYSIDGTNWTLGSGVPNNSWQGVAYGAGKYVAVANSGTDNRVMTSVDGQSWESLSVTPAPYFNAVTNLTAVANADGSVNLDWDAPTSSNVDIYAYGVSFYDLDEIGGTTSGGWGVWTNQGTTYSLSTGMFSGSNPVTTGYGPVRFGIKAGNQSCFSNEGVGPCVYGPEITVDATVLDPTPPTTTTTIPPTTTTTITPEPEPTDPPDTTQPEPEPTDPPDTTEPEPEPTLPPDTITEEPDTTDGGTDGGTGNSEDTTSPETTVPEPAPEEETPDTTPELPVEEETSEQVVDDILADDPSPEELADAVSDALTATESEEELVSVATELLTSDLDPEQFAAVIDEVFSQDLSDEALAELVTTVFEQDLSDEEIAAVVGQVFTADISDEAFAEVLNTVFEEPLSDEAFDSVIDAILDEPISDEAFDELVDVLGGDSVSDEQVVAAVDSIIENGLSEEQSVSIATSGEVLESITGDQATEIFATVPITDISDAEAAALVEAVQDAPTEVKEAFEEEINIFAAGNVDTYVPLGSSIPVSTRRVLIAGTALTLTMIPIPVQVSPSRVGK